jgi:hypothetical protein
MLTWRDKYNRLRPDSMSTEELREAIEDVESAIFERTQDLTEERDGNGELKQIEEATEQLLRLQIEKLNYPSFVRQSSQQN